MDFDGRYHHINIKTKSICVSALRKYSIKLHIISDGYYNASIVGWFVFPDDVETVRQHFMIGYFVIKPGLCIGNKVHFLAIDQVWKTRARIVDDWTAEFIVALKALSVEE